MDFKIFANNLYYEKYKIGYVRYIDYKDNGRHGYGISCVSNIDLLNKFHEEAKQLYPNAENPYIEYLDRLF